jgi:hypothetical protein
MADIHTAYKTMTEQIEGDMTIESFLDSLHHVLGCGDKGYIACLHKVEELNENLVSSNTALGIVKDENEVNKKNLRTCLAENKELGTENAKLRGLDVAVGSGSVVLYETHIKKIEDLQNASDEYYCRCEIAESKASSYDEMRKECVGLRKENKKLQQYALDVHNFAYGTDWDDKDIVSAMDFDGIVEKMKKDEENVTKENEALKNAIIHPTPDIGHDGRAIDVFVKCADKLWSENEELKEENEKLNKELSRKNKLFEEWGAENKELKEENEKLKEENAWAHSEWKKEGERRLLENEELKKENKSLIEYIKKE